MALLLVRKYMTSWCMGLNFIESKFFQNIKLFSNYKSVSNIFIF